MMKDEKGFCDPPAGGEAIFYIIDT